ncbi:MAG: C2 family cysteine protease, partial [Chloroflexota bacterium]
MSQTGKPNQPEFGKVPNSSGAQFEEIKNRRVFLSGIHPNDVDQGLLGDCYFLSSIASIAMQNSNIIKEMINSNDDGTYTVKLFKRGWFSNLTPTEITVDGHFPIKNNKPAFAGLGDQFTTPDGKAQKE